jgi:protein-tyrosine phosphatase
MDDGAKNLEMSLEMARMACDDRITTIACTPHIQRTVYDKDGPSIHAAVGALQRALAGNKNLLGLVGGDTHVDQLTVALSDGLSPSFNASRNLFLEPPQHAVVA